MSTPDFKQEMFYTCQSKKWIFASQFWYFLCQQEFWEHLPEFRHHPHKRYNCNNVLDHLHVCPKDQDISEKITWNRLNSRNADFYVKLIAEEFKELNVQFFVKSLSRSAHVSRFSRIFLPFSFTWKLILMILKRQKLLIWKYLDALNFTFVDILHLWIAWFLPELKFRVSKTVKKPLLRPRI